MKKPHEHETAPALDSDEELEGFDESPEKAARFIGRRLIWMGVALAFSVVGLLILRAAGN